MERLICWRMGRNLDVRREDFTRLDPRVEVKAQAIAHSYLPPASAVASCRPPMRFNPLECLAEICPKSRDRFVNWDCVGLILDDEALLQYTLTQPVKEALMLIILSSNNGREAASRGRPRVGRAAA